MKLFIKKMKCWLAAAALGAAAACSSGSLDRPGDSGPSPTAGSGQEKKKEGSFAEDLRKAVYEAPDRPGSGPKKAP